MNKKKLILTVITIILLILVFFLTYLLWNKFVLKKDFENTILSFANKNETTIFQIEKILLFSNCDAKNKTSSASNFTLENVYQYTDMAIFISNMAEENNLKNTFKKVSIENIQYTSPPAIGEPNLYFKSINQFAKSDIIEENRIQDKLDFTITSEDEANLDSPTLYNNLANPITLSYVNSNIKTDYTITDTSLPITYDGSLLKRCNVVLNSIACQLSFDLYITNNLEEEYKCTVSLSIPLETNDTSIYDGNITTTNNNNYKFYRYK